MILELLDLCPHKVSWGNKATHLQMMSVFSVGGYA